MEISSLINHIMTIKVTVHEQPEGQEPIYCVCDIIEVKDEVSGKLVTIVDKSTEIFYAESQLIQNRDRILEILKAINNL